MLPSIVLAQKTSFSIIGKIGSLSAPCKAYLSFVHPDGFITDSAIIDQGNFTFQGTAKSPRIAYLTLGRGLNDPASGRITFYLEQGPITVVSADSLANAVISGGKLNADYRVLQKALEPVTRQDKALGNEYQAASAEKKKSEEFIAYITKKENILEKEERSVDKLFIMNHPASWVSFFTLKEMGGAVPDVNEIEPLFDSLSAALRLSPQGVEYGASLKGMEKSAVGVLAPDFTQADTSGKTISLHDFRGKYVLVDFWASWCGPCRAENPNVVKAFNKYKDSGFTVLGVSLDEEEAKDKWVKAIKDDHVYWTQVSDLKGWKNSAAKLYAVQAIPQNFLIDPNGKIVAKNLRGDDLYNKLAEIFGKK